jgi:hypothetical protein
MPKLLPSAIVVAQRLQHRASQLSSTAKKESLDASQVDEIKRNAILMSDAARKVDEQRREIARLRSALSGIGNSLRMVSESGQLPRKLRPGIEAAWKEIDEVLK